MTLKLILIRHMKSSWDSFGQDDHSRPLNERGRNAAALIGKWLADHGHCPDEVLCSDAERTRETLTRVSERLPKPNKIGFERGLYLAPAPVMFTHLVRATERTVAMIGHNPGIADFADIMAITPPQHSQFEDYPTGATTVMTFRETSWADVGIEKGTVIDFTVPRDLE